MKFSDILQLATVRIILHISKKNEIRYSDLSRLIRSRGTLSLALSELNVEGLIQRKVVATVPIQTYYSLTKKGKRVAIELERLENILVTTP